MQEEKCGLSVVGIFILIGCGLLVIQLSVDCFTAGIFHHLGREASNEVLHDVDQ